MKTTLVYMMMWMAKLEHAGMCTGCLEQRS